MITAMSAKNSKISQNKAVASRKERLKHRPETVKPHRETVETATAAIACPSFITDCLNAFNLVEVRRREALYGALAITYTHLLALRADESGWQELDAYLVAQGHRLQSNSDLAGRLLKAAVAGSDRVKVNDYARVLRAAEKDGVAPENFATWIDGCGGVSAFRPGRGEGTGEARETKLNDIRLELMGLQSLPPKVVVGDAKPGELRVAIVRVGKDGKPEILTVSDTESVTNAALLDYSRNKPKVSSSVKVLTIAQKTPVAVAQA